MGVMRDYQKAVKKAEREKRKTDRKRNGLVVRSAEGVRFAYTAKPLPGFPSPAEVEPINHSPQHEGCEAVKNDIGAEKSVPVCMGGTALIGCNDADICLAICESRAKLSPNMVEAIFRDDNNPQVITGITMVRKSQTVRSPASTSKGESVEFTVK